MIVSFTLELTISLQKVKIHLEVCNCAGLVYCTCFLL